MERKKIKQMAQGTLFWCGSSIFAKHGLDEFETEKVGVDMFACRRIGTEFTSASYYDTNLTVEIFSGENEYELVRKH